MRKTSVKQSSDQVADVFWIEPKKHKKMRYFNIILSICMLLSVMTSCNQKQNSETKADEIISLEPSPGNSKQFTIVKHEKDTPEIGEKAIAKLSGASGSDLVGEAIFTQIDENTVNINVHIKGVTPGEHAIHLHQNGDCSAPDATSAGGHWNPTGDDHGKRTESSDFHKGDISNIPVGENGKGMLSMDVKGWTIGGDDKSNILNKAVIIHASADDFTSQPSGAAGKRIGCGVIELAVQ